MQCPCCVNYKSKITSSLTSGSKNKVNLYRKYESCFSLVSVFKVHASFDVIVYDPYYLLVWICWNETLQLYIVHYNHHEVLVIIV